jgi:hypothetical protein
VVPIINLEWIQKLHRDKTARGYSREAIVETILRRMPDYIHYICPQFSRTHEARGELGRQRPRDRGCLADRVRGKAPRPGAGHQGGDAVVPQVDGESGHPEPGICVLVVADDGLE